MRNEMIKMVANKIAFLNDRSIAKDKCFFASKLNTKWFCFICNLEHSIEINLSFGFQRTNNNSILFQILLLFLELIFNFGCNIVSFIHLQRNLSYGVLLSVSTLTRFSIVIGFTK